MKPGPRNKKDCPSEVHIRIPDDVRSFIDSYGQVSKNDRIVEAVRELSKLTIPQTLPEVKNRLVILTKEQQATGNVIRQLTEQLSGFGLDEEDIGLFFNSIEKDVPD